MMKQQLWAVNSFLLGVFCLTFFITISFKQTIPRNRDLFMPSDKKDLKKNVIDIDELYGPRDIFGLFEKPTEPTIKTLDIPKAPQFSPPKLPQAPKSSLIKMSPPLAISISGIIFSPSRTDKSVAMISDETNKEVMYHVGDRIKDGMIIKIGQERVVILRSNGQQETFFLRKTATLESLSGKSEDKDQNNKLAIEKAENSYDISKQIFSSKIQSLGDLIKEFDFMPLYVKNEIKGFKIGNTTPDSFAVSLGIKDGDILISIQEQPLADVKNRLTLYNLFTQPNAPKEVTIGLQRDKKILKKQLTIIENHRPRMPKSGSNSSPESPFVKPETESRMTEESYNEMINSMRQQLTENMRSRAYSSRIK
jgi:type II secretion system protein C